MKLVTLAVLGVGVALGAAVSTPDKGVAPVVTQADVEAWTKSWQKRLDLGEWNITAQIVRVTDLKPDTVGNLKWNSGAKTAFIKVLNPLDYNLPTADIATDIEYTIVHELIHLQLSALPHDAGLKMTEERVVNRISEALFQLEKGSSYKPRTSLAKDFVKTPGGAADPGHVEASRAKAKL